MMLHRGRFFSPRHLAPVACAILTLALTGCVPLAGMMGLAPSTIQTAAQLDQIKLAVDGASFAGSGKTLTDHAISIATGYDCSLTSALKGDTVCAAICR